MPHNSTESLTSTQTRVLAALLTGKTVTAAAEVAGVGRESVHRWLREDPAFQAAFGQGKAELLDATRAELRTLASEAVGALRDVLGPQTPPAVRLKAAETVLAMLGANEPEPVGPTTPADAARLNEQRDLHDRLLRLFG